jgi:hypothetical protein
MPTANPSSILDSVKKAIGFDPDYTAFDLDLVMFVNATFGSLQQLGVGPAGGFLISDNTATWSQFVPDQSILGMVQQYLYLKTRMVFDTPERFGIAAFEKMIDELGWRLNVAWEQLYPPFLELQQEEEEFVVKVFQLQSMDVITPDAYIGNTFYLALQQNATINAPVNGKDGERIMLELISNGFTVSWGSGWNFGDSGTPTLSGSATDIISAIYRQSAGKWYAGFTSGF